MKKALVFISLVFMVGCSSYGQDYLSNPSSIIRDPHFSQYKDSRDDLESSYLRKEITYAEYVERKDNIDMKYSKEVQERNDVISSSE